MNQNQVETEHTRGGGLSLFLAFVGGALVGGTAAVLLAPRSGAETRRRLAGAVDETKDVASRVPRAFRQASSAAQAAFTAALQESEREAREDHAASHPQHS
jgi:gas vesicle protein